MNVGGRYMHHLLIQQLTIIRPRRSRCEKTFPWTICRSVCQSSALWKNGESDPDAVWHRRSDGSRDQAGGGVWRSVHRKGLPLGRIWGAPLSKWAYRAYVCYSAATRLFSNYFGQTCFCYCPAGNKLGNRVSVKLNLSGVQNAGLSIFWRPLTPRH